MSSHLQANGSRSEFCKLVASEFANVCVELTLCFGSWLMAQEREGESKRGHAQGGHPSYSRESPFCVQTRTSLHTKSSTGHDQR